MSSGSLELVKQIVRVTNADGTTRRYVLAEEHEDGAILLRPDTRLRRSWSAPGVGR